MADFGQWLGEDRTPESAPRETETKLPNGVGIAVYPNKDEYHGKIENSERVGKGVYKWWTDDAFVAEYDGEYKNNKKDGKGKSKSRKAADGQVNKDKARH